MQIGQVFSSTTGTGRAGFGEGSTRDETFFVVFGVGFGSLRFDGVQFRISFGIREGGLGLRFGGVEFRISLGILEVRELSAMSSEIYPVMLQCFVCSHFFVRFRDFHVFLTYVT